MTELPESKHEFAEKITRWTHRKIIKMKYRNLVFKGGGVRGIAYMGALKELERLGILERIEKVAGSSAGAIAALMVSLRLSADEIKSLFDTLNYSRVPQTHAESQSRRLLSRIDLTACSQRLIKEFGWYSSDYFYQWLQELIADVTSGSPRVTFADFKKSGYRDLYVVVSNMTKHQSEVMSAETTPHVAVADAVRMSISIPLFFNALRFNGEKFGEGDLYVDGGLFENYPLHIFDQLEKTGGIFSIRKGINWRTLGLFLYAEKSQEKKKQAETKTLIDFINLLMENLNETHQLTAAEPNKMDLRRTIRISDCGIFPTRFDITAGSDEYNALFQSGQKAVQTFFANEYPIEHQSK